MLGVSAVFFSKALSSEEGGGGCWSQVTEEAGSGGKEVLLCRLQLYGPVCMEVPASIYQLTKGTIYVSEDMARPIEPMDLIAF